MPPTNNSPKPVVIIDGKVFDLSKIDFNNVDNNPELMAHIDTWLKKKEKAEARAEKKRLSDRATSTASHMPKTSSGKCRFITFVKSHPPADDPAMKSFYAYAEKTVGFPQSSDPRILALYLYTKLNHLQTKGFQLYMILYKEQPNNQLPKDLRDQTAFLDAINAIVYRQNSDPNYRYS